MKYTLTTVLLALALSPVVYAADVSPADSPRHGIQRYKCQLRVITHLESTDFSISRRRLCKETLVTISGGTVTLPSAAKVVGSVITLNVGVQATLIARSTFVDEDAREFADGVSLHRGYYGFIAWPSWGAVEAKWLQVSGPQLFHR